MQPGRNSALPLADSDVNAQSVESGGELTGDHRPLVAKEGKCTYWRMVPPPAGDTTLLHPSVHALDLDA